MRKIVYFLVALLVTVPAFAAMPEWVANPYIDYPSNQYVAASGFGKTQSEAESDAVSSIASFFGVGVESLTEISVTDDTLSSSSLYQSDSKLSVSMNNLAGVTFREHVEEDGLHYVLAVMDKAEASAYYYAEARSLSRSISSRMERIENNIGEVSAFSEATSLLEDGKRLESDLAVLRILSPELSALMRDYVTLDEINNLVSQLRGVFTLAIEIDNDVQSSLETSISRLLEMYGIAISDDSRYLIKGSVETYPSPSPRRGMVYVDYDIFIDVYDRDERKTLLSGVYSGREGHRSIAQATRRIALQVEDKILDEFGSEFASAFSLTAIN